MIFLVMFILNLAGNDSQNRKNEREYFKTKHLFVIPNTF